MLHKYNTFLKIIKNSKNLDPNTENDKNAPVYY